MLMHRERLAQVKAAQRRREEGSLDLSQRFRKIMHRSAARALGRISSSPTAPVVLNRRCDLLAILVTISSTQNEFLRVQDLEPRRGRAGPDPPPLTTLPTG